MKKIQVSTIAEKRDQYTQQSAATQKKTTKTKTTKKSTEV